MIHVEERPGSVRFRVYVQPRASRTEIAGILGDALKVRLAAPPLEGEANAELISSLAKVLGVPKSAVRIVHGHRGRNKIVEVEGVTEDNVQNLV